MWPARPRRLVTARTGTSRRSAPSGRGPARLAVFVGQRLWATTGDRAETVSTISRDGVNHQPRPDPSRINRDRTQDRVRREGLCAKPRSSILDLTSGPIVRTIFAVTYRVEIEHQAARQLVRLSRGDRAAASRVDRAIGSLADNPRPAGATKLVGSEGWRLRVGDYRVVYLVEDAILIVTVTKIGHRRDVYERCTHEHHTGAHQ